MRAQGLPFAFVIKEAEKARAGCAVEKRVTISAFVETRCTPGRERNSAGDQIYGTTLQIREDVFHEHLVPP
jgi:hypothetical protein